MQQDILHDVLNVMKISASHKTNLQKLVVLSFDETKIYTCYEFDKKRSLFDKWKQPIYIAYDAKMTKECLESIISKL